MWTHQCTSSSTPWSSPVMNRTYIPSKRARQLECAVGADPAKPWGNRCMSSPLFAPRRYVRSFDVPGVIDLQARHRWLRTHFRSCGRKLHRKILSCNRLQDASAGEHAQHMQPLRSASGPTRRKQEGPSAGPERQVKQRARCEFRVARPTQFDARIDRVPRRKRAAEAHF
jgi:hypothetical protein